MRRAVVYAAILGTVGCAPFVATEAPRTPTGKQIVSERDKAHEAYLSCVYRYAMPRWNYDATVYELADAAGGACKAELSELRSVLMRWDGLSFDAADRVVKEVEGDTRSALIAALIESRNTQRPVTMPPPSST